MSRPSFSAGDRHDVQFHGEVHELEPLIARTNIPLSRMAMTLEVGAPVVTSAINTVMLIGAAVWWNSLVSASVILSSIGFILMGCSMLVFELAPAGTQTTVFGWISMIASFATILISVALDRKLVRELRGEKTQTVSDSTSERIS